MLVLATRMIDDCAGFEEENSIRPAPKGRSNYRECFEAESRLLCMQRSGTPNEWSMIDEGGFLNEKFFHVGIDDLEKRRRKLEGSLPR